MSEIKSLVTEAVKDVLRSEEVR
ncbi:DUF826 domain-containing protein, partial [Escherichia coli]|nr:DUF826 domain-containing protein [Escherichia coli]EFG3778805.1 DUF826 domain-containing protein [Escherichia coli]